MESKFNKAGYILVALVWNIAIASVTLFLVGWPLDIIGIIIDSDVIRGYVYGVGIISTVSMFWFGLLAAFSSRFVRCNKCNSRAMSFHYPFFVSLTKCKCTNCGEVNF